MGLKLQMCYISDKIDRKSTINELGAYTAPVLNHLATACKSKLIRATFSV